MYKDYRAVEKPATTASTPEAWAENFAGATPLNARKERKLRATKEFELIQREIPAGGRILDAGAGAGDWVAFLNRAGYRAEGCDYSPALIERLRRTYPDITWTQTDIRSMPFDDDTFDGIVSWGVIEHDEDGPAAALKEFRRVLKRGGKIIVTVPRDSKEHRHASTYLYTKEGAPTAFFQYLMSDEELVEHVRSAGFDIVGNGMLPGAALPLVSPRITKLAPGPVYQVLNAAVAALLSNVARYCVMTYCVARKA